MNKRKQQGSEVPTIIEDSTVEQEPLILEDATTAGVLGAFDDVEVTSFRDEGQKRTHFKVTGNVKGALQKITTNYPIG